MIPFQATVLLLTVAAVGTIALAHFSRRRRDEVIDEGQDMTVTPAWYMTLAAVLFVIGMVGILVRRNALVMFMSIELMLNAVNLTFVAAGRHLGVLEGQISVLFVMVVAAAEVTIGLAIIVAVFQRRADRLGRRPGGDAGLMDARRRPPSTGCGWSSPFRSAGYAVLQVSRASRIGEPRAGWLATLLVGAAFVVAAVASVDVLTGEAPHPHRPPVHLDPGAGSRRLRCCGTRCRR